MLVSNLQLPLAIIRLEDDELERTSCCACTCAQNRCFRLILFESIAVVVISCLDIGIRGLALIKYEAVAMLYAMALESIVGFFIGRVKRIWRGSNILHAQLNKASQGR